MHVYEIRPRKDKRGFDLISDVLPFGGLWYTTIPDAIDYAKHRRRAHDAVISVYDGLGNLIVFQRPVGTIMRPGGFLVRCFTQAKRCVLSDYVSAASASLAQKKCDL